MDYTYTYKTWAVAAAMVVMTATATSCEKESLSAYASEVRFQASSATPGAGDTITLDIHALGEWEHCTVTEYENGRLIRILTDSTMRENSTSFNHLMPYRVASNVRKGTQLQLVCELTARNGKVIRKELPLQVSATMPLLNITTANATVAAGGTASLHVYINGRQSRLKYLRISEGDQPGVLPLADTALEDDGEVFLTYTYKVPKGLRSGEVRTFHFETMNEEGATSSAVKTIRIK